MRRSTWANHDSFILENRDVRMVLWPSLGARVVSLVDRHSGREWLVQGAPPGPGSAAAAGWAAESAIFGGDQAFGWDECLPTVSPCQDPLDPAAPPLRDHGDQWGRATIVEPVDGAVTATWTGSRWPYTFRRTLRLDGAAVVVDYEFAVTGERALPVLWSMHPLLALEPGASLVLEPDGRARVTHHVGFGPADRRDEFTWPNILTDDPSVRIDVVRPIEAGQAAKLYLDAASLDTVAARGKDGAELRFTWDRAFAPTLGIWIDYGGWPPGEARHQVALEPTTSADDDLARAIAAGRAPMIEPGHKVRWAVRLELVAGDRARARSG
jgi:hypothetical protein